MDSLVTAVVMKDVALIVCVSLLSAGVGSLGTAIVWLRIVIKRLSEGRTEEFLTSLLGSFEELRNRSFHVQEDGSVSEHKPSDAGLAGWAKLHDALAERTTLSDLPLGEQAVEYIKKIETENRHA